MGPGLEIDIDVPGKPVAHKYGLLSINYWLLWGIVADYFRLLGVPGRNRYRNRHKHVDVDVHVDIRMTMVWGLSLNGHYMGPYVVVLIIMRVPLYKFPPFWDL